MFKVRMKTLLGAALVAGGLQHAMATDKDVVEVAFVDPLSGPAASLGVQLLGNIEYQVASINERGGLNGRKIELVKFDNKLSPEETQVQFQRLAASGIRYIIQSTADSIAAVLINSVDRYNRRNPDAPILYLNYGANGAKFTNESCSFWHFLFDSNTTMKMHLMIDWLAGQPDVKRVFLINQDYNFGHEVSQTAIELLKQRRPDVEIVGNVFHPLAKINDFSPYVAQIKASGADAVITGNWGDDLTRLIRSAGDIGLELPMVTLYAVTPGTPTALGRTGVGRVYSVWLSNGDYENADLEQKQVDLKSKTGFDYWDLRAHYMLEMLKQAADAAKSTDPTDVAFALEGVKIQGPFGEAHMRQDDHQIQVPMFVSVLKDGMKHGLETTGDLNFSAIKGYSADEGQLPTTCKMKRPSRS